MENQMTVSYKRQALLLFAAFLVASGCAVTAAYLGAREARMPVKVSEGVAACEMNGNAKNAFNIVDVGHANHVVLYSMTDGALNDDIGRDGTLKRQTIVGVTQPRFPGDEPAQMTVDPAAGTCRLKGFAFSLK
jgi:hypothetical protein